MLANLLEVAGVNHVITIDLHASQMQGFFRCPVDNLVAEPLIAHWIKMHVPEWKTAVVVSKNPGGAKRVTSLADSLKLDFGIIMTDRARPNSGRNSLSNSTIFHGQAALKQQLERQIHRSKDGQDGHCASDDHEPSSQTVGHGGRGGDRSKATKKSAMHDATGADLVRTQTASSATGFDDSEMVRYA